MPKSHKNIMTLFKINMGQKCPSFSEIASYSTNFKFSEHLCPLFSCKIG